MLKPYILYNGKSYFILCREHEFDVDSIGINRDKVLFLDNINNDEIMSISYNNGVQDFNNTIEEKYKIALDIFIDSNFRSTNHLPAPLFEIVSEYSDGDNTYTINQNFNDLQEYIDERLEYYLFNLDEYYESIHQERFFRSYFMINIPALVLSRNDEVYSAMNTFFSIDELEKMQYHINSDDKTFSMTIKTYYIRSSEIHLNELFRVLDNHTSNNKHPIGVSVVNTDHPAIRSVGEIYINLTFEIPFMKKQLLAIFMNLKALINEECRITVFH